MATKRAPAKAAATSTPTGPGARWGRAALPVNPFAYKGKVSPSVNYSDEAAYNTALLDKCEELGDAVEITYRQREPGNIVIDFIKKTGPGGSPELYYLQYSYRW